MFDTRLSRTGNGDAKRTVVTFVIVTQHVSTKPDRLTLAMIVKQAGIKGAGQREWRSEVAVAGLADWRSGQMGFIRSMNL